MNDELIILFLIESVIKKKIACMLNTYISGKSAPGDLSCLKQLQLQLDVSAKHMCSLRHKLTVS